MKPLIPANTFSGSRFAQVLKCGFLSKEFRLCLMVMGVMYLLFLFTSILNTREPYDIFRDLGGFLFITLALGSTLGASLFAASLSDKGSRISHIMLPATNAEKFLARLVVVLCGTIVASFAAWLVLSATFAVLSVFSPATPVGASLNPFANIDIHFYGVPGEKEMAILTGASTFVLLGFSTYLLGGMLWKKKSWFITSLILLPFLMAVTNVEGVRILRSVMIRYDSETAFTSDFLLDIAVMAALALLNFWLTWRMFKRMQAVRPTFMSFMRGLRRKF